ncbi:thiopurine S-methyltransferase [Acinetobacter sp. WZC-1]|uniref:thiopurine S-methyltransferase n=1 Tax=Acinetobacter sp. WZC-1 TaxID=3459034 RepID=UPI00403D9119
MDHEFWHQRWRENQIGFHQPEPNPLLVKHIAALSLPPQSRIFVPLSGKSLDIGWLLAQGFRVAAIELNQTAINELIQQLSLQFNRQQTGDLIHYHHEQVDLFVGDFFHLNLDLLGSVDAIYDRAAMVALPAPMRDRYTRHLIGPGHVPQLLISYEYDQGSYAGPPFSVSAAEIQRHYHATHQIELLQQIDLTGNFKGENATEKVWSLKPIAEK